MIVVTEIVILACTGISFYHAFAKHMADAIVRYWEIRG